MKNNGTSTKKNKSKKVQKSSTGPLRTTSKNTRVNNNLHKNQITRNNNNIKLNKSSKNIENNIKNNVKKDIINDEKANKTRIRPSTILKIAFFIGIIIVFVYLLFNLETFNLENIEVEGNTKYTDEEIIQKSNLKIGENVFKQLLNDNNKNIALSYISKSSLHYNIPDTIVIKVEERYPMYIALDSNNGKYYKIDNEGYLLEECDLSSKQDELLVEGFTFGEDVKFGEKINDVYIDKLDVYNSIKNEFENFQIEGSITKVNFSNSLTIVTLDGKLNIVFANDSNLNYKVSFLKGIMQKNGNNMEGTIDMSVENPVYSEYD